MPKPLHCFSHCPLNKYTMMVKDNTDYARVLEELKHIYKQKYGVVLDRELLYVIVRINELQVAVNKKMDTITKVSFQSGKDYFYYSLGKYLAFIILGIGLTLLSCYFFIAREEKAPKSYQVIQDESGLLIKLKNYNGAADTLFHVERQQQPSVDRRIRKK